MTTAEKSAYLLETKHEIAQAIVDQGVDVSGSDSFRSYAQKIRDIKGGPNYTPKAGDAEHANRADIAESIEGVLPVESGGTGVASMVDLKRELGMDNKTDVGHEHVISDVFGLNDRLDEFTRTACGEVDVPKHYDNSDVTIEFDLEFEPKIITLQCVSQRSSESHQRHYTILYSGSKSSMHADASLTLAIVTFGYSIGVGGFSAETPQLTVIDNARYDNGSKTMRIPIRSWFNTSEPKVSDAMTVYYTAIG